jgi:polysaccharide pyruvyl transferase WcaK-like protein
VIYKISNARWSSVGDAAIYDVQAAGLSRLGWFVTESVEQCDAIILGGGGTLYQPDQHVDRTFYGLPCGMHFKDLAETLYNNDSIPFYVLGAGCQDFGSRPELRQAWRDLLGKTTGISVRDNYSKTKLASDLLLPSGLIDRICVYPDPVFELYNEADNIMSNSNLIMISARWQNIDALMSLLEKLRESYKLVWCPMEQADYEHYLQYKDQRDYLQASSFFCRYFPDYRLYLNTLRKCFMNISDRLHAFIFSLITGRGILSLYDLKGNQKVTGLVDDRFGTVGYPYRLAGGDTNTCLAYIQEMDKNRQEIFNQFNNIALVSSLQAKKHYSILL